jgi:rhodanese-related sulfurtransferase
MERQIVAALILLFILVGAGNATEYPLRAKYPDVKVIEPEELVSNLDNYVIVDVRSKYEYDTIHIAGAHIAAVSNSLLFPSMIKSLRINNPDKAIVFYCNGIMCAKSYDASMIAAEKGVENVLTMDAGVFNWVTLYPEHTVLMGKKPAPAADMISDEIFKQHTIPPSTFVQRISNNSVVIDVRDDLQRRTKLILRKATKNVPLGKTQDFAVQQASEGKTLLIYDAVGKQVRWLQYYLEKAGIKDYYFMEGGVERFLAAGLDR